jgi:hypothetical protein
MGSTLVLSPLRNNEYSITGREVQPVERRPLGLRGERVQAGSPETAAPTGWGGGLAGRTTGGSAKPGAHAAGGGREPSASPVRLLGDGGSVTLLRGFCSRWGVAGYEIEPGPL